MNALTGARTQREIIFPGMFEALNIPTINAISGPIDHFPAFSGRVTDYLADRSIRRDWGRFQFMLCGSLEMIEDVKTLLRSRWAVPDSQIIAECFRANTGAPIGPKPIAQRDKQTTSF